MQLVAAGHMASERRQLENGAKRVGEVDDERGPLAVAGEEGDMVRVRFFLILNLFILKKSKRSNLSLF